jgi:2-polyprenyl-3-methyl-5-hydroxy-6-metoxy-1,4-benzoquinol methylase
MRALAKIRMAAKEPIRRQLAKRGIYRLQTGPADYPTSNNSRDAVDAYFSDPDRVTEYLTADRIAFYDEVAELLRARVRVEGRDVADVGCGTGHLLAELHEAKSRTGYDFSPAALRIARTVCPDAHFEEHDIYDRPLNRFDIVCCCETLEHMFHPARALRSLWDMVREDGVLLLTVPNGRRDTTLGHINFWSPESWSVFLAETLSAVQIENAPFRDESCCFAFIGPRRSLQE